MIIVHGPVTISVKHEDEQCKQNHTTLHYSLHVFVDNGISSAIHEKQVVVDPLSATDIGYCTINKLERAPNTAANRDFDAKPLLLCQLCWLPAR